MPPCSPAPALHPAMPRTASPKPVRGRTASLLPTRRQVPPSSHPCGVFTFRGSFCYNYLPPASGSRHLPPARVHALFASRIGLAAAAASPSQPAFCLPRWARGSCRQPIASRFLPPALGSRQQPPAHSLPLFASRVGLAAAAASP